MSLALDGLRKPKRYFNENNKVDVELYRQFLINGGWGLDCCPFILEETHFNVPDMIKDKLIRKFLKV